MAGKKAAAPKTPEQLAKEAEEAAKKAAQKAERARQKAAYEAAPGTPKMAAVCADGITVANFEKLSQKASGKSSLQEWRDAVVEALRGAKAGDKMQAYKGVDTITKQQAQTFNKVAEALSGSKKPGNANYTSSAGLENLLTGKVSGLTEFGKIGPDGVYRDSYYHSHRMPMWRYLKAKGLAYEGFWQHETQASFVNAAGQTVYADPSEVPYLVSSAAPPGTFAKITAPNGNSTYVRILERGTDHAEVSLKTFWNLGYPNTNANGAPVDDLKVHILEGSGSLPKKVADRTVDQHYLNNDEIQRAGKLIEEKKVKEINSRQDLEKAEGKEAKQASADPAVPAGGGGQRLETGFQTVAIGANMRRVGYACAECVHEAGGYVLQGSATVYVGKYPFSRIGDMTSDELAVETGDETVLIGGAPSSAQLA